MGKIIQLCFLLFCTSLLAGTNDVIRSAAELSRAIDDAKSADRRFEIEATLIHKPQNLRTTRFYAFWAKDDTGQVSFLYWGPNIPNHPSAGDKVKVSGHVNKGILGYVCAYAENITIIGQGPKTKPLLLTTQAVNSGKYIDQLVSINGTLTDVFRDDIDPHFIYAILSDEHGATYHVFMDSPQQPLARLTALLGTDVTMTGICARHYHEGGRKHLGLEIIGISTDDAVRPRKAPSDPYAVPPLHDKQRHTNLVIEGDLSPKRVRGRVLAVWQGDRLLIRTAEGDISEIHVKQDDLPRPGDSIEAVGTPETDLYQLNLSKAIWRKIPDCAVSVRPPERVTAQFMLADAHGNREVKTKYSGRAICVTGTVRALPAAGNGDFRLNLSCDGYDVPVDFSPVPEALGKIEDGCTIEATGVCVIETENWRPQTPFPHAKGFSVILRTADDVRVISRPPWWTPKRLAVVIGLLLLTVIGFGIRNRVLKRMSELRVKDRTRLAVELHDALSQTLTGVALELQTTTVLANANSPAAIEHLNIASKTLLSCRQELRNCLQDLRSTALDLPNMSEAIRLTLEPHVADAKVSVRFNVPRKALSDNAAHAVLSIVRELTLNAIRHGHATAIRIAGTIDGDLLRFSVRDNGSGFDPDDRPGVRQGHFGLQGVLERVRALGGSLEITSKPGHGTRVAGTIRSDNVKT